MKEMRELRLNIYGLVLGVAFAFCVTTAAVLIAKYIKWLWSVL
jgi:hypothetical protein